MREIYCDLCGNKMFILPDEKDYGLLCCSAPILFENIRGIEIQINNNGADICNVCRERIIKVATNTVKKIKEEFENEEKKLC